MKTRLLFATILAVTTTFSAFANAQQSSAKQIFIQEGATEKLVVSVTPTKKHYKVNEPIRFNVSGNKDFFLYLFSVDKNNKNATLLFPNKSHSGNKFKNGHKNTIPSSKINFVSGRAGQEKVVAIASSQYFEWDTTGYAEAGKFLQVDGVKFKQQVKAFRIHLQREEPVVAPAPVFAAPSANNFAMNVQTANVHIQNIFMQIHGSGQQGQHQHMVGQVQQQQVNTQLAMVDPVNNASAIVFSGTDKKIYKNKEVVEILVGANKAGTLHLFTAEPNGHLIFLTKQQVDGKSFATIRAEATAPFGNHALVVAFSQADQINDGYLKQQYSKQALAGQTKGLHLLETPEPVSYSVSQFRIVR